jgi:hypothetical protein
MRRIPACWFLAALTAFALFVPAQAQAQDRRKIRINTVRVGFPSSLVDSQFKSGNWTPVYVDITAGPEPIAHAKLTIEAVDTDDVRNNYTVDVPLLDPGDSATVMAYTKPGSESADVGVSIRMDGVLIAAKGDNYFPAIPLDHHLYLTIGGRAPGLKRAVAGQVGPDEQTAYSGPEHVVALDDIRQFPTRWFGYEAVDMMFLTTSDRDFLTAFLNEREGRKDALAEWVRRGGHIVVSVGRNQDIVSQIDALQQLLPVTVKGMQQLPLVRGPAKWTDSRFGALENPPPKLNPTGARPPVEVATLLPKAGRDVDQLLTEPDTKQLLIARGAYGMGKVTVVAFDLDRPPFTSWLDKGQNEFWKKLILETAPAVRLESQEAKQLGMGMPTQQNTTDLGTSLQENLEHFSDMPVISFGWVALFILVYILIVGPLDYFFLKKVVKRLELTWITFPTVVITISVVAYFTAYWLKGDDQRINKIDVLDVDLHTQQVYGTTWFSIFSPRIQNYIVGLKPADALSGSAPVNPDSVTMSWMGRPESGAGGVGRARSQGGLFRRAYDYAPEATGMIRVPIQVWATKNFVASWDVPLDPSKPIVVANLEHPRGNPDAITGSITSNFPVPLQNVAIYQVHGGSGRWYPMENLLPGVPQRLDNILAAGNGQEVGSWINSETDAASPGRKGGGMSRAPTEPIIKSLMFEQSNRTKRPNNLLRNMDESWRLGHKNEVILYARLPRADGESESLAASPEAQTALWLGELPTPGATRPPILGSMSQAAYLRIFVPVLAAD